MNNVKANFTILLFLLYFDQINEILVSMVRLIYK